MAILALGVFSILLAHSSAQSAVAQPGDPITFARDVAPILQENCQACHRPGSIGPMSLMTYEEVRPWAHVIRLRVETRTMPPWHIDDAVGIAKFQNDVSLSDEEIDSIVRWIEGGMERGDPADLPKPIDWPDGRGWQRAQELGKPDLVIRSDPYTVRASGQDQWWSPVVETGLHESRYVRAIELKPSDPLGNRVTHHVMLFTLHDGRQELLTEWAMGKVGEVMPAETGRLIEAGSEIRWDIHYSPIGQEVPDDRVELALWFHPEGYEPEYRNALELFRAEPMDGRPRGAAIDIQPGEVRTVQGIHRLEQPVRIESFQPHMHLRGREMTLEVIYPDGRREILSRIDRFHHNWQISYRYAEEVMPLLPAGSRLVLTAVHDNSEQNPNNPDPSQWVGFGRRTVDEMAHAWIGITHLDQEGYERLLREREAKATSR
ncbi:MAG: hypothetical protein GEU90_02785 [Gemmatimonas sp.]|nr:hypothetical protein [Gemmatimonas sp.]